MPKRHCITITADKFMETQGSDLRIRRSYMSSLCIA